MQLPKELTIVTPFSKYLAMFLFILLPFFTFFMGINYQKKLDSNTQLEYQHNQNLPMTDTTYSISNATRITQPIKQNNSYIGWNTYTWPIEGLNIKYPNGWIESHKNPFPGMTEDGFTITGPQRYEENELGDFTNGNIIISFELCKRQVCGAGTPSDDYITNVLSTFFVPGYGDLHIYEDGATNENHNLSDTLNISDNITKTGLLNKSEHFYFKSGKNNGYIILAKAVFWANYTQESGPMSFNKNGFDRQQDYPT